MVASLLLPGAPASAAPPARPQGLAPSTTTVEGHPRLSWGPVAQATSYDVQLATEPTFADPLFKRTTVNQALVVTPLPPAGQLWWRVRSARAGEASTWTTAAFTQAPVAAPAVTGPEDGASVTAPLLEWEPVPGANRYEVQLDTVPPVDDEPDRTTFATALVPTSLPGPGVQHWRVRAVVDGHGPTPWSAISTFQLSGPAPVVLTAPADGSTTAERVRLGWQPSPGALTYDVQVATDATFETIVEEETVDGPSHIVGQVPAGEYHWRVRPRAADISAPDWAGAATRSFTVEAPAAPEPTTPAADAVTGDPLVFTWTPVATADQYTVEVSSDPAFPGGATESCVALRPRFTPTVAAACWPDAPGEVHWRVTATSTSTGLATTSAPATFDYAPALVMPVTPTPGEETSTPVFTWEPVAGAREYRFSLESVDGTGGGGVNNRTIDGTGFGPGVALDPDSTYRWNVRTFHTDGREGPALPVEEQPTFTVTDPEEATAESPEPLSPPEASEHARFPLLSWEPVVDATRYRIFWRDTAVDCPPADPEDPEPDPLACYTQNNVNMAYGAGTVTNWLAGLGTFEWRVAAYDGADLLAIGEPRTLLVTGAANPTGLEAVGLGGGSCGLMPPDVCSFTSTPMLRWAPVPEAGTHQVRISSDPSFETDVTTIATESTALQPDPLAGASGTPYYWQVRSCIAEGFCSPWGTESRAFTVTPEPPTPTAPGEAAEVPGNVELAWTARPGAAGYRVQVAADPAFTTAVTTVDVPTTSTVTDTLPGGTHHWRVAVRDGAGLLSAYSPGRSFVVVPAVPQPDPTTPVTGTAVLTWSPTVGATTYDVEVTVGEQVSVANTPHGAFAPNSPLAPGVTLSWRVRAVDAFGNRGEWSGAAPLVRPATAPEQTSPGPGALVPATGGIFAWQPVPEAERYRFERRRAGVETPTELATTGALEHAPPSVKADGFWEWRVVALDNRGVEIGVAPWRSFVIDSQRPTVTKVRPAGPLVKPKARFKVFFSEPVTGVTQKSLVLKRKGRPGTVRADVLLRSNAIKAVLVPRKKLKRGSTYVVKVKKAVKDQYGLAAVPHKHRVTVRR